MSATITITLPPDLEKLVEKKAAADGQGVEEYTLSVLRKVTELPTLRELFADVHADIADIKAKGITDEEVERDIDAVVAEVRARRRA